MAQTKHKEMDMLHGGLAGKLILFALPLAFSSILQQLFNSADVAVVGRFAGDTALAAVGSCVALVGIFVNLIVGLSVGPNAVLALLIGQNNREEINRTLHTVITFGAVLGVGLMIVGWLTAKPILVLSGTPESVLDQALLYIFIYFLSIPFMLVCNFGSAVLRSYGDSRRPMYYLLISGTVNVILNLFLVIVLQLAVAGVAIATVISNVLSAGMVLTHLARRNDDFAFRFRRMHIEKTPLLRILQIGIPAGIQGAIFSVSNVFIQSGINSFGENAIADSSLALNFEYFTYDIANAFAQAAVTFTSQNYGAGNYHRIRKIMIRAQGCVLVVGLVLGNAATLAGRVLLSIYTTSPPVIEAGLVRMGIVCTTYALCGMMDVMVGGLRGIGYSIMPMLVSLVGACGLRLLWIATIFQLPQFHTIQTIYWSYPISWAITFGVHVICFLWAMKKVKRQLLPEGAPAPVEVPPTLEEETVSE